MNIHILKIYNQSFIYNYRLTELKPRANVIADRRFDAMHLASAVCGPNTTVQKILPLIKSAILMSRSKVNFHLFIENETKTELEKTVKNKIIKHY